MYKFYINNNWADAIAGKTYELINPANEQALMTLPYAAGGDAKKAIEAASAAFDTWSLTTPYQRADYLKKAAQWIREHVKEIAYEMVLESGKPFSEAEGETAVAANLFEWYAEEAKRSYGKVIPTNRSNKRSSVIWQPMGVVGIIPAWNFPAYNPARAWAAALAAGCTVVAKPAESTPVTALYLMKAFINAGLPAGVLNVVFGDAPAIGDSFLSHPAVKKISFTGSTRVGKILMDGASRTHTKLSLELGGNAPVLIFDDVDVDGLAKAAAIARFRNNGQVCIAPQRFYVQEKIYKAFAAAVTRYVSELVVGNGTDTEVQIGPLISSKQRDSVIQMLAQARNEKATVFTGGGIPETQPKGWFLQPAVVGDLRQDSVLAQNEIFGPVLPLFAFSDIDDAVAKANDTTYGLAAYIFTNDIRTAVHVSERLHFGIVGINEWAPHGTESPFGGWNASGLGHESGSEGLFEYMEKKLISYGGL